MSKLFSMDGSDTHIEATTAAPRQFAQGGSGHALAKTEPAVTNAPHDLDGETVGTNDQRIMLQLASFEGRAL